MGEAGKGAGRGQGVPFRICSHPCGREGLAGPLMPRKSPSGPSSGQAHTPTTRTREGFGPAGTSYRK